MTTLTQIIHGPPGVGKSWYGETAPAPRLVLDAEGGSRYPWRCINGVPTRQRVVQWDPVSQLPPEPGEWEVAYVNVQDYKTMTQAYAVLNSGAHPFRSVMIDTLDVVQKRCQRMLFGVEALRIQDWNTLLIRLESLIIDYVDLTRHPLHPIEAITFLCHTEDDKGTMKPDVQGALQRSLPGMVDIEGFMYCEANELGGLDHKLLIQPLTSPTTLKSYECKDRTHVLTAHYGMILTDPDIEEMLIVKEAAERI